METLVKENHLLKQQLQNCFTKVAKTQKVIRYSDSEFLFANHFESWRKISFVFSSKKK